MLQNAANILLSRQPGTLVDVSESLLDQFYSVKFIRVDKSVVNFDLVETQNEINFMGMVQPSSKILVMTPQGQRYWDGLVVYAPATLTMVPDEIISYDGKNYRVQGQTDWSKYGYVSYTLIEDFK